MVGNYHFFDIYRNSLKNDRKKVKSYQVKRVIILQYYTLVDKIDIMWGLYLGIFLLFLSNLVRISFKLYIFCTKT